MRANVTSIERGGAVNPAVRAPIETGFAGGFETMGHVDRLRRRLKAMHSARRSVHEPESRKPVFASPQLGAGLR